MVKLLITGFRHSGTTMTMQLIKSHPQVGWIHDEESYIEFDKPRDWVLMMARKTVPNLKEYVWGEKIPWGIRDTDIKAQRAIQFSKKWLKYFRKQARIIQVLRHPLDVALSGGRSNVDNRTMKFLNDSLPRYIDFINSNKRCATIVYEDLVTQPEVYLPKIFQFLNINDNKKIVKRVINTPLKFGKINSSRAFAHKNKDLKIQVDYDKIIKSLKAKLGEI